MYTRSFFTEEGKSSLPENYDGTAFSKAQESETKTEEASNPFIPPDFEEKLSRASPQKSFSGLSSIMERLPIKNLSSIFSLAKNEEDKGLNFGTEEILICAAALYMFFSKNGDKECAIILFILLFVR